MILGAETPAGRALATALSERGATIALVAASPSADVAFSVQRLARRLGAGSQAIDATNEMALRVMVRQVSKILGGLDLTVFAAELGPATGDSLALTARFAAREMSRGRGGKLVVALREPPAVEIDVEGVSVVALDLPAAPDEAWAREALAGLPL